MPTVTAGGYMHGYRVREVERLADQAGALAELLHAGTSYPAGSRVLEAGCGVGAQTAALVARSPGARIVAVDLAAASLAEARRRVQDPGASSVAFAQGDLSALPFASATFDHLFICFVLEHVAEPHQILAALGELLAPGGTITAIEGDQGSTFFHPDSDAAHRAIECQVTLQAQAGGDARIGRRLRPLLVDAGFEAVQVSPRMVYVDASRPDLVDGYTRRTFTAMIEGVREPAIEAGLIEPADFDAGIRDLHRTTEEDGVFCYTFFKGTGFKETGLRR